MDTVTTDLESLYSYSLGYSEPTELTEEIYQSDEDGNEILISSKMDSQDTLDYAYGTGYYIMLKRMLMFVEMETLSKQQ